MKIELPTVFLTRVDLITVPDEGTLNDEYIAELETIGFTLKGGAYVMVEMWEDGQMMTLDYVEVARRIKPVVGEPTNDYESHSPEFMTHRAMRNQFSGSLNWGADFINMMIVRNGGEMPSEWLEIGFADATIPTGKA